MTGMLGNSMHREASGTSWQPEATPMEGLHLMKGPWMFMVHGFASGAYDWQSGGRGDDSFFGSNMIMVAGWHEAGINTFGWRTMLSLEPLTVPEEGYPLLFQTGETADGINPLVDHQHPHDLFMEMALTDSIQFSNDFSLYAYVGLPGEPAIGPPVFMHRFSGAELMEAPLGHHLMDSTHVTFGVATLGIIWKEFKLEGSIFNGREPDQHRWDIEIDSLDSYAGRLSYNPTPQWALQVSLAHLSEPEQLEPGVDVERYTASVIYHRQWEPYQWQTILAWGHNTIDADERLNGFLLESACTIGTTHTLMGRLENDDKNELFATNSPLHGENFNITKLSLGYIFDLPAFESLRTGIGTTGGIYFIPENLEPFYGKIPMSLLAFVRIKLAH